MVLFAVPHTVAQDSDWLKGFGNRIEGEILGYHSAIKGVNESLLVRSLDSLHYIEWDTEPVPLGFPDSPATFAWLANYDSTRDVRSFHMDVNGSRWFTFTNSHERDWTLAATNGAQLRFHTVQLDRHGDYNGYHFLTVPSALLRKGEPMRIRVTGESAAQRTWYMVMMYGIESTVEALGENALFRDGDSVTQRIRVDVVRHGEPVPVRIEIADGQALADSAVLGRNSFYLPVDVVTEPTRFSVSVTLAGETTRHLEVTINPVRRFDVYFLPHSHLDIGYTDRQDVVLRKQWRNIEQAVDLARRTADYSEGARYRWNVEGMWVVDEYLRKAPSDKRDAFVDAVHKGWIGLEGLYANNLTALMRPEELYRFAGEHVSPLFRRFDLAPESIMITDVPGYTWGLLPALLHNGIRYFSSGPNHIPGLPHGGDRVGYTLETWGDDPFYWEDPAGTGRVLFWMSSKGYSWFHGLVNQSIANTDTQPILDYLKSLADNGYPYDIVYLRYTIGGDNGPPDPGMPDFVQEWNETHESPKLRIATTSEVFRMFEERYGSQLQVRRGDFTPYWEDGAASSARETALARNASERLVQSEILWSILDPNNYPWEDFEEAWRNVLLFNEHTWGAWNSITQPDDPDVKEQWRIKQQMALDADHQSRQLFDRALGKQHDAEIGAVEVFNTSSWTRTDLVTLPPTWELRGDRVVDGKGVAVPTQRLSDGTLAFVARDVPPLGSSVYRVEPSAPSPRTEAVRVTSDLSLRNGAVEVTISASTGDIDQLRAAAGEMSLTDSLFASGLNHYVYTGLNASNPRSNGEVRLTLVDDGPVVRTAVAESDAPGTDGLSRMIRIVNGLSRVYIENRIEKTDIREKENVRFGFPFHVPDGQVTIDLAWTTMRPEIDQLEGSNKNYFTPQHLLDISNEDYGVAIANIDAPLVELGGMTAEAWMTEQHRPWIRKHSPSQLVYSWVMNNSWHTNYKASQSGPASFRYVLFLHGKTDATDLKRLGIEASQPLVVRPAVTGTRSTPSLFRLPSGSRVMITSVRPLAEATGYTVRLYNPAGDPSPIPLRSVFGTGEWRLVETTEVKRTLHDETLVLRPGQILTLEVGLPD